MLKYNYCTYKGDNQMTENTYILAVDPGNEKTGVAILSPSGEMICRKIISSNTFNKDIERILTEYSGFKGLPFIERWKQPLIRLVKSTSLPARGITRG